MLDGKVRRWRVSNKKFILPGRSRIPTLAERLRRSGPMTAGEARALVRQMAAALGAAHKAGVIHRDFKGSNVILVPSGEGDRNIRVVVTDFGLARSSIGNQDLTIALYNPAEGGGTIAYRAPE